MPRWTCTCGSAVASRSRRSSPARPEGQDSVLSQTEAALFPAASPPMDRTPAHSFAELNDARLPPWRVLGRGLDFPSPKEEKSHEAARLPQPGSPEDAETRLHPARVASSPRSALGQAH